METVNQVRDDLRRHIEGCEAQSREMNGRMGKVETTLTVLVGTADRLEAGHAAIIAWQKGANATAWKAVATIGGIILTGVVSLIVIESAAHMNAPETGTTISTSYIEKETHNAHANRP